MPALVSTLVPASPAEAGLGHQLVLGQRLRRGRAGSSAVATRSMSLQVSAQRRTEPATSTSSGAREGPAAPPRAPRRPAARGRAAGARTRRRASGSVSSEASTLSSTFGPSPFSVADRALLGRRPQALEVLDPELVVEPARGLGAEPGNPRHLDQRGRELRLQLLGRGDAARLDQGLDLLGQRLADPRHLGQPALLRRAAPSRAGCRGRPGRRPGRRARGSDRLRRARRGCPAPAGRRRSRRCAWPKGIDAPAAPRARGPHYPAPMPESAEPPTRASGSSCPPTTRPRTSSGWSRRCASRLPESRRVLIVDDNSPDGTGEIADRLAAERDDVSVLHRERKEGLGPAYLAGFRQALAGGAELIVEHGRRLLPRPRLPAGAARRGRRAPTSCSAPATWTAAGSRTGGRSRRFISRGGSSLRAGRCSASASAT